MENIKSFFAVIEEDLRTYRPETTPEEVNDLLMAGMQVLGSVLPSDLPGVTKVCEFFYFNDLLSYNRIGVRCAKKAFICRPLFNGAPIPHRIPDTYTTFQEDCQDIYKNYMRTIKTIGGTDFVEEDITRCYDILRSHDYVVVWSNSSILVKETLSRYAEHAFSTKCLSFGGSVLIPRGNISCINVYHESDWIMDMIVAFYRLDISSFPRNALCEVELGGAVYDVIILSDAFFPRELCDPKGEPCDPKGEPCDPKGEPCDPNGEPCDPKGELSDPKGELSDPKGELSDSPPHRKFIHFLV